MTTPAKVGLYQDDTRAWGLIESDALLALAKLPDRCVDAIVTDPPYGIGFHDESWDGADIRRAVETGAERLSAGESLERWTRVWASECLRVLRPGGYMAAFGAPRTFHRLVSGVEDAGLEVRDQLLWLNGHGMPKSRRLPGGVGTALKPAFEPILLARAPLVGGTARNLTAYGTGVLNIDATRIAREKAATGYWPANVALSHSDDCAEGRCDVECPVALLDETPAWARPSRLFYCTKASRQEREAGCEQLPERLAQVYIGRRRPSQRLVRNTHPTVKPVELMRWLVKLVTPPGGCVLDPFTGSGTTGIAAVLEGRLFLGIEREPEYVDIACARLARWAKEQR